MPIIFELSLDLFNIYDELNINGVLVSTDILVMSLMQKYLKIKITYKEIILAKNKLYKSPLAR